MKTKDTKQRYVYFFTYRGDKEPAYTTMAYSVTQAVKQLEKANPTKSIYNYFENNSFEITREPFVPKEKPVVEPKTSYKQLDFKGFIGQ